MIAAKRTLLLFNKFSSKVCPSSSRCITSIEELPRCLRAHVALTNAQNYTDDDVKNKELVPRSVSESKSKVVIPLGTNEIKRKQYISSSGNVRIGKILEDLDVMAVYVCMMHNREIDPNKPKESAINCPASLPRNVVTISLNHMDLLQKNMISDRDLVIEGYINWVGRTSMETSLQVYQENDDKEPQLIMRANFLTAARHPLREAGVRVHPLKADNPEELAIIEAGELSAKARKLELTNSLIHTYPTVDEFHMLHNYLLDSVKKSEGHVYFPELKPNQAWLHKTKTEVHLICHPEYQNIYGKIFGGFLMKGALELAQLCVEQFCKERVAIIAIDDITFNQPVEVGDFLHFTSFITHTKGKFIQTHVRAEVINRDTFTRKITNEFNFTMETLSGTSVAEVLPKHYSHGTLWLDGHRHLEKVLARNSRKE